MEGDQKKKKNEHYPDLQEAHNIGHNKEKTGWQAIKWRSRSPSWFLQRVRLECHLQSGVKKPAQQAFSGPVFLAHWDNNFLLGNQKRTFRNSLFFVGWRWVGMKILERERQRERKRERERKGNRYRISSPRKKSSFPWIFFLLVCSSSIFSHHPSG